MSTVIEGGKRESMTINSFSPMSFDPPLILWSIRNDAGGADAFIRSRHFIVNVLTGSQHDLAQSCSVK